MKRDAIFYKIFQRFPSLLFSIVDKLPDTTQGYRFESVEIKEPDFRIDGLFMPPENSTDQRVYFAEFQFQRDELLYHRLFCEALLYMYRNNGLYKDWYAVVVFPSRRLEPKDKTIHEDLLDGKHVTRIYLNELGDYKEQSVGVNLLQLTAVSKSRMEARAKQLIERVKQEDTGLLDKGEIIEVITKIVIAKLSHLSREEVEAMLAIELEESRVYKELREDARREVTVEVTEQITEQVTRQANTGFARKLMRKGKELEEIADLMDLSVAEVQELLEQGKG